MQSRKFSPKQCRGCQTEYLPTGSSSYYCSVECRNKHYISSGKMKVYRDTFGRKTGRAVGIGSGGHTKFGEENHMYSSGRAVFRRWAREYKNSVGLCMRCNKDIKNATQWEWAGHHKDHNKQNNVKENLEVLCKRCHQIEHDSGFALLSKVQRLSREGVLAEMLGSATHPTQKDDDIVQSPE